jgi:hypothetical protein
MSTNITLWNYTLCPIHYKITDGSQKTLDSGTYQVIIFTNIDTLSIQPNNDISCNISGDYNNIGLQNNTGIYYTDIFFGQTYDGDSSDIYGLTSDYRMALVTSGGNNIKNNIRILHIGTEDTGVGLLPYQNFTLPNIGNSKTGLIYGNNNGNDGNDGNIWNTLWFWLIILSIVIFVIIIIIIIVVVIKKNKSKEDVNIETTPEQTIIKEV